MELSRTEEGAVRIPDVGNKLQMKAITGTPNLLTHLEIS